MSGFSSALRRYLSTLGAGAGEPPSVEDVIARYAFENQLAAGGATTGTGRAWLAMPTSEGIRLLLAIELARARGPEDDDHLSRDTAAALLRGPLSFIDEPRALWPASWETMKRLADLQVARIASTASPNEEEVTLTTFGREVLADLLLDRSVWTAAATTLLSDEHRRVLETAVPSMPDTHDRALSDAASRDARLVAHEVRNALAPVRVQLDRLYRALGREAAEFDLDRFRGPIDDGVARVFHFIDDRLRVASVVEEGLRERFELDTAVREAEALTASEAPDDDGMGWTGGFVWGCHGLFVEGSRQNFMLSIGELVRNARRLVRHIEIETTHADGHAWIHVDDGGPGVPEPDRARVFLGGFSTRGGSGQGLALAKQVIESMGGSLSVGQSPLGGARFSVRLPLALPSDRP